MSSTKTAVLRLAIALAALCTFAGTTIQAQEGSQVNQTPPSVSGTISAMRTQANAPPVAFPANPFAASLKKNHRALATQAPRDLAAELNNAKLPVPGKVYSFPALAKGNLLAPASFPVKEFHDLSAPGLNTSKLRRSKVPKITGAQ